MPKSYPTLSPELAAFDALCRTLTAHLGDSGEARSLSRIAFEDGLGIKNPSPRRLLTAAQVADLQAIEYRLLRNEPIQHIVGFTFFYGEKIRTTPDALIPRPETEELVAWVLETGNPRSNAPLQVIDLGTGTGCIPIVLQKKRPAWRVFGLDISEAALALAQHNAQMAGVAVGWLHADMLAADQWAILPSDWDIIVSNPPYIPQHERTLMASNVINYEPALALFVPDHDPLLFYRAIGQFARARLKRGGSLLVEINEFYAKATAQLFEQQGFVNVVCRNDISGKPRLVGAIRS